MKKILLFFSLAVFAFVLAGSAQAAVTVTSPAAVIIDQGEYVNITWTSGIATSSVYLNKVVSTTDRRVVATTTIATRVSVSPKTYSWLVGKNTIVNSAYQIKVCEFNTSVCGVSNAFTIKPAKVKTQAQVLDLFKTAIGNRYNNLNQNRNTGTAGVSDLILRNWGNSAAPNYKISTTTVNNAFAYRMPVKELLEWFRDQFKLSTNQSLLNASNKDGIRFAIINRFNDFCTNDYNARSNNLKSAYTNGLKTAETAKQAAIRACDTAAVTGYNARMAVVRSYSELITFPYSVPDAYKLNSFLKSAYLYIETEEARLIKEKCINDAYNVYFTTAGTGAIALRQALQDNYIKDTGARILYTNCLGTTAWIW